MKTYGEMTDNVLHRAHEETLKKERRRKSVAVITASGLCVALLLSVIGVGLKQMPAVIPTLPSEMLMNPVETTEAPQLTQHAKVKVTYLSNIEGQTTQEMLSANVTMPLNGMIRVRDIRGLTKEEVDEARKEEFAIAEEFKMSDNSSFTKWEYPAMIATIVGNGAITLDFGDYSTVRNVDIKTTEVGFVKSALSLFGPNPEKGTIYWPNVRDVSYYWSISGELAHELHKDPTIPLESIRDTVTITVDYANGTVETLIFDITVNEAGEIFVTQRGNGDSTV